ncbi:hypothetical protein [Paenibacillus harenae]|uniref:hypothetical protein n=1 Tax=Paenibacillus harenae TaxID=306543 RepID=UPI0003FA4447|nr:hypothetical protein [Paenibacillus harenae]
MLELLFWVIGCYVLAALSVHLAYRIRSRKRQPGKHYVLVADERQHNMEWVMRNLFSFSRRMGTDVRLTIIDRGVSEETKAIVERMARSGHKVKLHAKTDEPLQELKDSKRSHWYETDATQLMWMLQAEGIVSQADHAVLVDLQNPADLSKMPF